MSTKYSFKDQKEGEEIILFLRRHVLTHLGPLFIVLISFIVPLFAWLLLFNRYDIVFIPSNIVWIVALVWFLLGVFFFVYAWLDWYLDIFVVTNIRIIDINQNGLFHRTVGETSLENVQDVIYEIKGIIPTLFNFGDVVIHTAGPTGDIIFEQVPHPQTIQRLLISEVELYKDENTEKLATPEDLLSLMLEHERDKLNKKTLSLPSDIPDDEQNPNGSNSTNALTNSPKD